MQVTHLGSIFFGEDMALGEHDYENEDEGADLLADFGREPESNQMFNVTNYQTDKFVFTGGFVDHYPRVQDVGPAGRREVHDLHWVGVEGGALGVRVFRGARHERKFGLVGHVRVYELQVAERSYYSNHTSGLKVSARRRPLDRARRAPRQPRARHAVRTMASPAPAEPPPPGPSSSFLVAPPRGAS